MVARHSNSALLPRSEHGSQAHKHRIASPFHGQSMVTRRTDSTLLPHSTDRTWSPGTQTKHCSPAPRTEHGRQALKHRIAPLSPGQSMVTRPSNTALLPLSTGRAWSPGAQTAHCSPLLHGQSMVVRHSNGALLPRSSDRAWSPGAQIAHCSPTPRTEHGHQTYKQGIAPLLHGQSMVTKHTNSALLPRSTDRTWSPRAQTAHCFPAPRTEHGRQAHKHRTASPLHGQGMVVRHSNSALLPSRAAQAKAFVQVC